MHEQGSLPLHMEHPAHNGTRTSRDAAADIKPRVATLRGKVLTFVASCGEHGATADEIERALAMGGNTVRPRLVELRETGCIFKGDDTRKTASGRAAAVWRFKP